MSEEVNRSCFVKKVFLKLLQNSQKNSVRGVTIDDVLKFRKIIKLENSCIVMCFSYIYPIINGKKPSLVKTVIKNLGRKSRMKTVSTSSNSCQFVSCCSAYVHVNSLNYSPFFSLQLQKKCKGKDNEKYPIIVTFYCLFKCNFY